MKWLSHDGGSIEAASSYLRVVRLTPAGRGAVATLLIDGPGARDTAGPLFRAKGGRPLGSYGPERLVLGRFGGNVDSPGEEVVVRCCGPSRVEVHCHGGRAAAAMIEGLLVERGCRSVDWRQWNLSQHADPIAAAAVLYLADARTRRTAAILLDQYGGALGRAFEAIERNLERDDRAAAVEEIDILLARAPLGRHLVRPWQVVVAGPPNAGKSTLLNALLGFARAITHRLPGTTRDVVAAATAINGWPVELLDTAGLRVGETAVERAGVEQARQRLAGADLVLWVLDRSRPFVPESRWGKVRNPYSGSPPAALVVHNKCDLPPADDPSRPPGIAVSGLTGQGIDGLLEEIGNRLVPNPPPSGGAVPFEADQVGRLRRLRERAGGRGE